MNHDRRCFLGTAATIVAAQFGALRAADGHPGTIGELRALDRATGLNSPPLTAAGPHWSALLGRMESMHAEMASVAPSGDSDVDFVSLMLPHHRAAVDMARTELLYGKDPRMRRLAQEIIADQQSEIELMQLWMKHRGRQL